MKVMDGIEYTDAELASRERYGLRCWYGVLAVGIAFWCFFGWAVS